MAATKSAYIPRFLLPQYGQIWRAPARAGPFVRPLNAELVRYASKTSAGSKSTTKSTTAAATATSKTAAAKKVEAPKAVSTKAGSSKTAPATSKTTSKAAPPTTAATPKATSAATKATSTKASPAKATPVKAPAPKATTPKTPTSQPAVKPVAPKTATAGTTTTTTTPSPHKPASVDPSKPLVLEKPEKFNPPSHGARLPRSTPKHYGGALSTEEVQAQKQKQYPGLPPPETSWSHWFINNRVIHLVLTLGTLASLAIFTFTARFKANSPFADMIPPISEFPYHPFSYMRTCFEAIRLHELHESAVTAEKRRRKVDDVAKRNEYRVAHGLPIATGLGSMREPDSVSAEAAPPDSAAAEPDLHMTPDGKRKKYWGIF